MNLEYNLFTESLMWMSYRYCIGRHTIASVMHANDIAKYYYPIMKDDRRMFTAKDIRNEISSQLNYILHLNYDNSQDKMKDFINLYKKDKSILWNNYYQKLSQYKREYQNEVNDTEVIHRLSYIQDLIPWVNLANLMDVESHKTIDGVECFEFIDIHRNYQDNECTFNSYPCIIESYINNPSIPQFLNSKLGNPYEDTNS